MTGKVPALSMFFIYLPHPGVHFSAVYSIAWFFKDSRSKKDCVVRASRTFLSCIIIYVGLCKLPGVEDHSKVGGGGCWKT